MKGMSIPTSKIGDFAKEYFALFNERGERADPMDRGGEYRSLLGPPGGRSHPKFSDVEAAAKAKDMILEDGKGNDGDTLGKRKVYVYDSIKFPFYQAEFCEYPAIHFLLSILFDIYNRKPNQHRAPWEKSSVHRPPIPQ